MFYFNLSLSLPPPLLLFLRHISSLCISLPYSPFIKMDSIAGGTASEPARITDRTRSMFRAILLENGVADTDDAILEQEMIMFFKLGE